jgi:8-oxo-dGTP pyrophosphatase MutT (NUDIX family)
VSDENVQSEHVPQTDHTPSWVRDPDNPADETLEENWLFRLRRERFRSRTSGRVHGFYVIHLADAVNVIAITPDHKLVMVRQFRAGSRCDSLETPGGLLEPGEDPLAAGARELLEETGYAGDPPEHLGTVWSNSSIMTSRTTTIVIRNVKKVAEPRLDPNEELTMKLVSESAIPAMIRDGRIDHALVVAGLLWWLQAHFPGRLAKAGPTQWKLGATMAVVAGVALFLGALKERQLAAGVVLGALGCVIWVYASWKRRGS